MSDFKAKITKFAFRWGYAQTLLGSLQRSPNPYLYLKGLLLRGRRGRRGDGEGRGRKSKGQGRGEEVERICFTQKFWDGAPYEHQLKVICNLSNSVTVSVSMTLDDLQRISAIANVSKVNIDKQKVSFYYHIRYEVLVVQRKNLTHDYCAIL